MLLAQAATVSIPVPIFALVGTVLGGAFGWLVLRAVKQIDDKQKACEEETKAIREQAATDAKASAEKLAALEAQLGALKARFDGSRKTDEILDRLLKAAVPSYPPGSLPPKRDAA